MNRLPEKYPAPVVLCDLEGRTHQEAARFLGWPIGTVKSRQSQARRIDSGPTGASRIGDLPSPGLSSSH